MAASVATEAPTAAPEHELRNNPGAPPAAAAAAEPELRLKGLKEGTTSDKVSWGKVSVSNAAGHARSHIQLESRWTVPPEAIFAVFTYPDNSAIFRDVQHVGQRRVVSSAPGMKVVEAEQLQDLKVLWIRRQYSTWLKVVEDSRDPECLRINFDLIKSDVLAQFQGSWEIRPVYEEQQVPQQKEQKEQKEEQQEQKPDQGTQGAGEQKEGQGQEAASGSAGKKVVGCVAVLHQQVLPKGIPPFMQNIPVMGDLLRGVALRAIRRVMDDLAVAVDKIKAGEKAGKSVQDVLRELCGVRHEEGHANGAVKSFAIDDQENADDEDAEEEAEKGTKEQEGGEVEGEGGKGGVGGDEGGEVDEAGKAAHKEAVAVAPTAALEAPQEPPQAAALPEGPSAGGPAAADSSSSAPPDASSLGALEQPQQQQSAAGVVAAMELVGAPEGKAGGGGA